MVTHSSLYPGTSARRQPVHTVYGGAHLFKHDSARRLSRLAAGSLDEYAPDAESFAQIFDIPESLAETVFDRVRKKLSIEAVEDLRIDFEDGYGIRPNTEEDAHAVETGAKVATGMAETTLPPFIGIRIKPFTREATGRAIRTLDLFLTSLLDTSSGRLPDNFVVTLPKVVVPEQVVALADIFDELETAKGLRSGSLNLEIMIETTESIVSPDGSITLPRLLAASRGRCTAAHFGAYDYTASLGVTAPNQHMLHQACDFARNMMQVAFAGTGIWLSDGATNILPIAPHRNQDLSAAQFEENHSVIHRAWRLHYDQCRHSLENGFYQGWDLHPAQIPARYAAVYTFFLEGLNVAAERLGNFVQKAARATLVGDIFDDAATGQGLLNFFSRAMNCGAITEEEATNLTKLTPTDLRSRSFTEIIKTK